MTELIAIKQRFGIIGNSAVMERAIEVTMRVAPTDLSVLVTGESGVGKEFFPQIIHAYSARKHAKYIAVNCGAIPEGTIDSELFGHEKGSFTGATEARKGYFEEANGGTIFLDEVAELPHSTQVRLLRVLQTGEIIRVGSSKPQKTDVRVVAATNVNLTEFIATGRFREDLYYRLNTVPIFVPPLRERTEDIYLLFRKFTSDVATQYRMPPIQLTDEARKVLTAYYWRGNVRQLKNVAEQISAVEEARLITPEILRRYLPDDSMPLVLGSAGQPSDHNFERDLLYKVLFDMRAEINDIRNILHSNGIDGVQPSPTINSLNTAISSHISPAHSGEAQEIETVEAEDVTEQPLTKEQAERTLIVAALKRNGGRRKDTAAELFMSERTLYRKIKELGIE